MFKFIRLTASFVCALALMSLPSAMQTQTAFEMGESYVFYTHSSSSQAKMITCSTPALVPVYKYLLKSSLTGESTRYCVQQYSAEELIEKYQAEILWTEEVDGIINYYCFSPQLESQIEIGEYTVNLHVAQSQTTTAVGTPIIFGGF